MLAICRHRLTRNSTYRILAFVDAIALGVLEKHWNGEILDSVNTAVEWMKTMTWKGNQPIVHFLDKVYKKGIKVAKDEMKKYSEKIYKSTTIPRWNLAILGGPV